MAAEAKNICQAGKDCDHVAGADEADAQLGCDAGLAAFPQAGDAEISTHTDKSQAEQDHADLDEADDGTAIKQEKFWFCTNDEDKDSTQGTDQPDLNTAKRKGILLCLDMLIFPVGHINICAFHAKALGLPIVLKLKRFRSANPAAILPGLVLIQPVLHHPEAVRPRRALVVLLQPEIVRPRRVLVVLLQPEVVRHLWIR